MRLAFNSLNSGLGNNGGSRTIILCSKILEELGHECNIIANVDNFAWFDHKSIIKHIPQNLELIIAVANSDVVGTLNSNIKKKAWYIRGHETWSAPTYLLEDYYRNPNMLNIVNSKGLQQLLRLFGAESKVVYQGIDFNLWEDRKLRQDHKIRIGCLYQEKETKRWADFVELTNILGLGGYEYVGFGYNKATDKFLTEYKQNPSHDDLIDLYSSCHIWFAPTELEGLHNVPIEASLRGCLIVCSDHEQNGMVLDYAFDDTAMIYKFGDLEHASNLIRNPDWSLIDNMQKCIVDRIGSRETNMKKIISYLEEI